MAKVLNYKVIITQGWNFETFRLSKEEFESMPRENPKNFAWFAWADTALSPSKRKRFNRVFEYDKRDFYINYIEHTILR